jgi:hypothetical protein
MKEADLAVVNKKYYSDIVGHFSKIGYAPLQQIIEQNPALQAVLLSTKVQQTGSAYKIFTGAYDEWTKSGSKSLADFIKK